jgi:hypothetical protein
MEMQAPKEKGNKDQLTVQLLQKVEGRKKKVRAG